MIRTCPLMGCTYSRLGATLGSPKLRLLSFLSHFVPFSPLYSLSSLGSYPSIRSSSPACCCVPRPLPTTKRPCLPPIPFPLSGNNPVVPVCLKPNNVCNPRCTLTRDFYPGGDIRRNFLNPSATTEYVEKTRH